ncbi:MAG: DUF4390 domain-containing protein [Burkholderiaceae bacterium]|jgi:hypothetical protein
MTMFRCGLVFFLSLALALPLPLQAQAPLAGDHIERVEPRVHEGELYIDADARFELSGELREAAHRGVPLYFTVDLEIVSRRWWWFDKEVVRTTQTWKVVYNALTRQWRVGSGDLSLPESTLDEALNPIRHIRGWAVADLDDLEHDELYEGRIRIRLDTSRLARPFQVNALNSSAWSLATPWKNFSFSISVDAPTS